MVFKNNVLKCHRVAHMVLKCSIREMGLVFNPRTWEAEADLCKFEASLVYVASSRTAWST